MSSLASELTGTSRGSEIVLEIVAGEIVLELEIVLEIVAGEIVLELEIVLEIVAGSGLLVAGPLECSSLPL